MPLTLTSLGDQKFARLASFVLQISKLQMFCALSHCGIGFFKKRTPRLWFVKEGLRSGVRVLFVVLINNSK